MPTTVDTKREDTLIHPGKIKLPGFDGVPLSEVLKLIIKGFKKGTFVTRVSSIAFNFLLAIVPTTVFIFTLIPFIPISNFQEGIIDLFRNLMPENAFNLFENTIIDVVTNRSGGLMVTMFFATGTFLFKWFPRNTACLLRIRTQLFFPLLAQSKKNSPIPFHLRFNTYRVGRMFGYFRKDGNNQTYGS